MSFYNGILNHEDIHESCHQRGLPGVGFKLDDAGNYDIDNKKLTNVKNGDMPSDVMVKSQIEEYVGNKTQYLDGVLPAQVTNNKAVIYSPSGGVHTNDLYLKDQYGQEVHVHTEDQDLNQCRLYVPNLKNNDSYGGRLKSDIMVTSIDQTIPGKKIFHDIEVPTPTIDGHASNKAYVDNEISKISDSSDDSKYVKKSGDTMSGSLIVPKDNYPVQGDLNKAVSYETIREIFLSRKETRGMDANLNMNGHFIDNLKEPKAQDHACTKGYTDTKVNSKADKSDLDDYLKIDGSRSMTNNLNMDGNRILKLPDPQLADEPTTLGYISQLNYNLFNSCLDLKGTRKLEGDINMDNHLITNLKSPSNEGDAVNKSYVDKNMIQAAHPPKNILDYIMKDVDQTSSEYGIEIDKIDDYDNSFHTYNKKVIYMKLIKDGNNYRARIGYNIYSLIDKTKNKFYTAVIEWLTTDNNAWNKMELFHNITSGSIISNQTRKFEDGKGLYYTRSIVQFEVMAISSAPLYLLSTIHIDGVNPTYPAKFTEVYNIIYGIDGEHKAISPNVYDFHQAFMIEKDKMKMLVNLDINNKSLSNIGNLSNNAYINIYGKVLRGLNNNIFYIMNDFQARFWKIHIKWISIFSSNDSRGKADVLILELREFKETRYQFTFPSIGGLVHIQIDKYFEFIRIMKLANTYNVAFNMTYSLFY